MKDAIPLARVHEGTWGRIVSFVQVGPKRAADGPLRWAVNAAMSSARIHFAVFMVLICWWLASTHASVPEQLIIAILAGVAALVVTGVHWIVTLAGMLLAAPLGWFLRHVPRPLAQVLGAASVGTLACLIEPIALVHVEPQLFRALAFVLGALWGAWLPIAASCQRAPS